MCLYYLIFSHYKIVIIERGKVLFLFSEDDGVTYVRVHVVLFPR